MLHFGTTMKKFLQYYFVGAFLLSVVYMGSGVRLRASENPDGSKEHLQQRIQMLRKELSDVMVALDKVEGITEGTAASTSPAVNVSRAGVGAQYKISLVNHVREIDPNLYAVRLVRSRVARGKRGASRTEYANISRVTHRGPGENKFDSFAADTKRLTLEVVRRDDRGEKFTADSTVVVSCYHKALDVQEMDPAQIGKNIHISIDGDVEVLQCRVKGG